MKESKRRTTLTSKKYHSMLLGGTLTMMVVSLLLMSDSIIAGVVIGSDAVAGITLVTPLYSFFFKKSNSLRLNIYFSGKMLRQVMRYSIIDASAYLFLAVSADASGRSF